MKNPSITEFFSDSSVTIEAKGALAAILATDESILQRPKTHIANFIRQSSVIGRTRAWNAAEVLVKHGLVSPPKPNNFAVLKGKAGFVYLIGPNAENEIKIGATTDLKRRLKELQKEHGDCCKLIASAPVLSMGDTEELLAQWFSSKNNHGEWYLLNSRDISVCKRILKAQSRKSEGAAS